MGWAVGTPSTPPWFLGKDIQTTDITPGGVVSDVISVWISSPGKCGTGINCPPHFQGALAYVVIFFFAGD